MPYKDPEKRREADRRWREANLEKARARGAAYRAANREARRAYRASQKDATRLHACEATLLQTPEGRAPWPRMNGRRIAGGDPPPPSLPPLTETIPHTWGSNYRMGRRRRRG